MSTHWRMALRYAGLVAVGALVVGVVVWALYGEAHAWAFLYGVGAGIASFVSAAGTVSMLTRRNKVWVLAGAMSFGARYGFVAVALAVPAYLGLWPVVSMLCGFVAVYLAENVVLLPGMMGMMGGLGAKRSAGRAVPERAERRVST